jgi:uncharacterized protein (DUF433 family)
VEIAPRIVVDEKLASGMGVEQVTDEYGLTEADVRAALAYAARALAGEQIRSVS